MMLNTFVNLQKSRPTIGLITHAFKDLSYHRLWMGVADAARAHDANLICLPAGYRYNPSGVEAKRAILYDLLDLKMLDGLLIWGAVVANMDAETTTAFYEQYHSIPLVIFGDVQAGIPSVIIDNYQGMRQALIHLIEQHSCRRIAFLRGIENFVEHEERYRAYRDVLEEYEIPFDPALVVRRAETGAVGMQTTRGDEAIRLLVDERNVAFDAIASSGDRSTFDALPELRKRGIRTPEDVAVVSFNDHAESQYITPPLTSVANPQYEMTWRAAEILLAQLRSEEVPDVERIPMKLMVRQSCGCGHPAVMQAGASPISLKPKGSPESAQFPLITGRQDIVAEMAQAVEMLSTEHKSVQWLSWGDALIDALSEELQGSAEGSFLRTLAEVLNQVVTVGGDAAAWQNAISVLRRYVRPEDLVSAADLESLWRQAHVMIGERARRAQGHRALLVERHAQTLTRIGQELIATFDMQQLLTILARTLPQLNIRCCYLSLYDNPENPTHTSRLILAYKEQDASCQQARLPLAPGGQPFPSRQLLPENLFDREQRYSLVLEPLFFHDQQIGVVVFEEGAWDATVYEILRGQISNALQGDLLLEQVERHSAELARKNYILDTFMETVPDLIYFKDRDGRITRANTAHAREMGFQHAAQEIGKTDFDFFPEQDAQEKHEREQTIIHTGRALLNVEEKQIDPDGREKWRLTTKMPLRNEHGDIIGIFGISRDITELKHAERELITYREYLEDLVKERTAELTQINTRLGQEINERTRAEQALRISEQQYRLLAENVVDGIAIVQEQRLVFTNIVLARMLRYAPDVLLTLDPLLLFHERSRNDAHACLTQEQPGQPEPQWQVELATRDGQSLWAEIAQTSILWQNKPATLLSIRNIHERKLREIRLEEERARLHQENITLKSSIAERYKFGDIIGKSQAMQRVYELILSAAASDVNVLVCGESGTGKELIARTIHKVSARKHRAFAPVNCASIPDTLFEREFFGHRKGAFTGADRDHPGLFDRAHQGVLFLDEVTELSQASQARLLRVLQDGEYIPLGSNRPKQADCLIVAATNKAYDELLVQGAMRKDFFYRICVIEIMAPPLRERKEDIPLLLEFFLAQYRKKYRSLHGHEPCIPLTEQQTLPGHILDAFYAYHWPGNVRELQNILQRYLATQHLDDTLPLISRPERRTLFSDRECSSPFDTLPEAVQALEKHLISEALAENCYHRRNTAKKLGISLRSLQYKLAKYDLLSESE